MFRNIFKRRGSIVCSAALSIAVFAGTVAGESVPWNEAFTLANGATSDGPPTSWTASRSTGTCNINNNRLMVNGTGTEAVVTTGVIDISAGSVDVSLDLVSQGALEGTQDYVKLFKKVNGGAEVLIGEKWGNQAATKISQSAISGTTLQLVIRAKVSAGDEYYYLDNLTVTGGGFVPSGVSLLGSWIQGNTHARESGTNRALVVMIYGEGSTEMITSSVTYGGQAMTKVIEGSYLNGAYSYTGAYILTEAGVAAASSGAIAVSWSKAPTTGSAVVSAFFSNVNQTAAVGASVWTGALTKTISCSPLQNSSGDMVLLAGTAGSNGTYTMNNGFTRGIPETSASFGDITSAYKSATGANETPSLTHSLSQRQTILGFVVKVAGSSQGQPPLVSITSPANGAVFTAPASITVNATASDPDGSVSAVELRSNGSLIGTDNTSPYSFSLNGLTAGSYTLEARAYDNENMTSNASIAISVNGGVVGESVPWQESFTLANGVKSDVPPTSWTATRSTGTFAVNNNRLAVNGAGTEAVLTTGIINISAGKTDVSIDLVSQGALETNQDYVKLYKKVNGGAEVLIGQKWGIQSATTIKDSNIIGTTLQLIVKTFVSASDEYYYLDNINVTQKTTWQTLGDPIAKSTASYADMISVNGVTYVAFADAAYNNRLSVYMHSGTSWQPLGSRGFSDQGVASAKLGQEKGEIYVLYIQENSNGGLGYVKIFNGTAWQTVGGSPVTTVGRNTEDIKIHNGTVYASFTERGDPNDNNCYLGEPAIISQAAPGAGWEEIVRDCTWGTISPYQLFIVADVLHRAYRYNSWNEATQQVEAGMIIERLMGTTWEIININLIALPSAHPAMALVGSKAYFAYFTTGNRGLNCEMFDGTSWTRVGTPDFITGEISDLSVTVSNGKPYIAFKKDGLLSVVSYNTNAWEYVGTAGFISGPWSDGSTGFNGKLCINGSTPTLLLSSVLSPTCSVMHFPQTTVAWKNIGGPVSLSVPGSADMLVVNGVNYVAAADPAYSNRLTVYKQNGTSWEPVGSRGISTYSVADRIALGQENGVLYVSYIEGEGSQGGTGLVKKLNGTSWQTFGTTQFTSFGTGITGIEISNGVVYVAFTEYNEPGMEPCFYGHPRIISRCGGTTWSQMSPNYECTGKFGSPYQISLANGILYAEVHEQYYPYSSSISLFSFNGSTWLSVTSRQLPDYAREGMKVKLDGNKIHAVYTDDATNTVKYEQFDGAYWSSTTVQNMPVSQISSFSMAISSTGKPYLGFEINGLVSVASYTAPNWVPVGIPDFGCGNSKKLVINGTTPTILLSGPASFGVMKFE